MTQTTVDTVYAKTGPLYIALELSKREWKLAFTRDFDNPRIRSVPGGDLSALVQEVGRTLQRWKMPTTTPIYSCYEAGRDGFWIHRALEQMGWSNVVVDPASIEVNRRSRRRKTDRLDAKMLVRALVRFSRGERDVWRVVRPPTVEQEDQRRLHREQSRLIKEQTAHRTRIRSLLATQGPVPKKLECPALIPNLAPSLRAELDREWQRLSLVQKQLKAVVAEIERQEKEGQSEAMEKVRKLKRFKGIGSLISRVLVMEFFGWRTFKNRRQLGSAAGLTGTPYDSGLTEREQGISKAGNRHVRRLAIELAWLWVRWQPDSELTKWFLTRFGVDKGKRLKRVGIVALARKLLVALWKYVEFGEMPKGAVFKNP